MSMGESQDDSSYLGSYREREVDGTLDDHEQRITKNERRWLVTKGALAMLATIKGVDVTVSALAGMI